MGTLRPAILAALMLALAGCAGLSRAGAPPLASRLPASGATSTVAEALSFDSPVLASDFPDPFLLREPDGYFAYATNSSAVHVQVARSADLRAWTLAGQAADGGGAPRDAMPRLPDWVRSPQAGRPDVWAPEVIKLGAKYVLYFSAKHATLRRPDGENRECIGAAVGDAPDGPFEPQPEPLVCAAFDEGVIDASPFRDGERLYLYFKSDGNCCGRATAIYAHGLAADGLSVTGEAVPLGATNDKPWERDVVEAPTMVRHDGAYLLFYSASGYGGPGYAVGYARCATALGPCTDAPENPILSSSPPGADPVLIGPGHQSILEIGGRTYMAYHAWKVLTGGVQGDARYLYLSEVRWVNGAPVVQRPLAAPVTPPPPAP